MKQLFVIVTGLLMLGCNNDKKAGDVKKEDAKVATTKIELPVKMSYEGTPAIGKSENVAVVVNFNTDFIAGKYDNLSSYLADSVTTTFADGSQINTTRDSIIAIVKSWRESMTSCTQSYISAFAIDNTDKGDQWVMQWIDEAHNYKDGKKEHQILHEDYRMVNGKIRQMIQYAQAVPAK